MRVTEALPADPTAAAAPAGSSSAPIGLLAGGGSLPAEVARAITSRGGTVHIVRVDADPADRATIIAGQPAAGFAWGEIGGILASLRDAGCREVLFVGGVKRPDLGKLRPDLGLLRYAPELVSLVVAGGDDGLIRKAIRFVERRGFRVVGIADVAPELLAPAGALGIESPDAGGLADILLGSAVVRALGHHDIGQAVIVADGVIVAIEGAEGTDRMLERMATLRTEERGRLRQTAPGASWMRAPTADGGAYGRGVLVKRPKPGQEMRIDVPAIGPATVDRAKAAGLSGIAVLAGATLAAERVELVRRADLSGIYVYGFTEGVAAIASRAANSKLPAVHRLAGAGPALSSADLADVRAGATALASLAALGPSGSAVVVNGYIIGIEPGCDAAALIERTAQIRPWGIGRWRRRAGAVVLAHAVGDVNRLVAAAAEARLAAIGLVAARGARNSGELVGRLASAAAAARIAVMGIEGEGHD